MPSAGDYSYNRYQFFSVWALFADLPGRRVRPIIKNSPQTAEKGTSHRRIGIYVLRRLNSDPDKGVPSGVQNHIKRIRLFSYAYL